MWRLYGKGFIWDEYHHRLWIAESQGEEPGPADLSQEAHRGWCNHLLPRTPRVLCSVGVFPASARVILVQLPAQGSISGSLDRCLDARLLTASSLFRELQDGELKKFCSRVSKLLQEDLGPDAADALRRLFLIVSATKYNRK